MKPQPGDVFCVYNRALEQYTACQVTKVKEKGVVVLILDWTGEKPLSPGGLAGLKPFCLDFLFWQGRYDLTNVPPEVPGNYIHVGNIPPLVEEDSRSYSGWDGGYSVARQRWWESIPEERRRAFKAAAASQRMGEIGGQPVKECTSKIQDALTPFGDCRELRPLRCLTTLECKQWHPGLMDYLREEPLLMELRLEGHGQKQLDLRGSGVQRLLLEPDGLEELWLGEKTSSLLWLGEEKRPCVIHAPGEGVGMGLSFKGKVTFHPELPALASVSCNSLEELDLLELHKWHPRLRSLRLWGKPGYLQNFRELKKFQELETFTTVDLFGFTGEEIPKPEELPRLTWFWMSSLPEEAAKTAKRLYKKREGLDLWITKGRKPEWLGGNLNNPFRHWDGMEGVPASSAKRAANLYKNLRKELFSLTKEGAEDAQAQAQAAVAAFVKPFNRMRFIETEEREDIYTALWGLLEELPKGALERQALLDVFEEERDF